VAMAQQEADLVRGRMQLFLENDSMIRATHDVPWVGTSVMRICRHPGRYIPDTLRAEPLGNDSLTVDRTRSRSWRYYSVFSCGPAASRHHRVCLLAKPTVNSIETMVTSSSDGITFGPTAYLAYNGSGTPMGSMAHNLAVLRLRPDKDQYLLMGGMQDYGLPAYRSAWLRAGGSGWTPLPARVNLATGIRLFRGRGWPDSCPKRRCVLQNSPHTDAVDVADHGGLAWDKSPTVVIHGTDPPGCVDRRPERSGYPATVGCEFDGRLSLVRLRQRFLLYARANLAEGALMGGRAVQVSRSRNSRQWAAWAPVHILGLPADEVDIYFFSVSLNPVANSTLIALFPLSQPPDACIAMAFSRDGVTFSRPYHLRRSNLAWRTTAADGSGPIEWRVEDQPAAGIIAVPGPAGQTEEVWIYIHNQVHGTSFRSSDQVTSHVVRYRMPASELKRFTEHGLRSLSTHPDRERALKTRRKRRTSAELLALTSTVRPSH